MKGFIDYRCSQKCQGDVTRDNLQRRFLGQQCRNNVVTVRNNITTALQRCVVRKKSLQILRCNIALRVKWKELHQLPSVLCEAQKSFLTWRGKKISTTSGYIRYFRNEKGKGVEMCPAIVFGMVTGDAPTSYWSYFFSVPSNSPRSLCEG